MSDQPAIGPLAGRRIALPETRELDRLVHMFEEQGAETLRCPLVAIPDAPDPDPVLPYIYASAADDEKVVELIDRMADRAVDAIAFTSSPQVQRLFEVAAATRREEALQTALQGIQIGAVGPVVAEELRRRGVE